MMLSKYVISEQLEEKIQLLPKEQRKIIYQIVWSAFEIGATQGILLAQGIKNEYGELRDFFSKKIDEL